MLHSVGGCRNPVPHLEFTVSLWVPASLSQELQAPETRAWAALSFFTVLTHPTEAWPFLCFRPPHPTVNKVASLTRLVTCAEIIHTAGAEAQPHPGLPLLIRLSCRLLQWLPWVPCARIGDVAVPRRLPPV